MGKRKKARQGPLSLFLHIFFAIVFSLSIGCCYIQVSKTTRYNREYSKHFTKIQLSKNWPKRIKVSNTFNSKWRSLISSTIKELNEELTKKANPSVGPWFVEDNNVFAYTVYHPKDLKKFPESCKHIKPRSPPILQDWRLAFTLLSVGNITICSDKIDYIKACKLDHKIKDSGETVYRKTILRHEIMHIIFPQHINYSRGLMNKNPNVLGTFSEYEIQLFNNYIVNYRISK